ncbi:spermine/spermidine synthase [delta proteobacterium NaphS2]|nr:spermine/spermidine synthase [delta proteobacterium NaphS2]
MGPHGTISRHRFRWLAIGSIVGVGISSVTTQILTIREFLSQFHGNEITISLVVFCWLVLTGLGTLLAKCFKKASLAVYLVLALIIGVLPLFQMAGIRVFRELFFTHGVSPGFYPILIYISVTIAPYCLLTGFILPYTQKLFHGFHVPFESGELYITDSAGDILGGVLFSFLLVYWFKPFTVIALTAAFLVLVTLLMMGEFRKWGFLLAALPIVALFYITALMPSVEIHTLEAQYGNIVNYVESRFGRIVVTKEGPQYTFWESGTPLYSDANTIEAEEKVHYTLSQRDHVKKILLVSGGLGETLLEMDKYSPLRVDYVELDPALTQTAEDLKMIPEFSYLNIINTDARKYIQSTDIRYGAVILDLPEPDTFQANRFYTDEFFSMAKHVLKKNGILAMNMDYSPNYLSRLQKEKLSILYHTLKRHFNHILVLPGEQACFIMSDGALSADIPRKLKSKGIKTAYIDGYFNGNVTKERIRELRTNLGPGQTINTDFNPRLMQLVFKEWFSRHGTSPSDFMGGLAGLLLLYFIFMKREEYILFSTGFTAMGLEMAVIFAFQIIYGYIYVMIGLIITAFLLGLLPGAVTGVKWSAKSSVKAGLAEVAMLLLSAFFLCWCGWFRVVVHPLWFLIFCFVFSFFAGFQFPAAARLIGEERSPAAGCLAADLCGAAVGALVVGTLVIPLWGVGMAVLLLIMVKTSSGLLLLLR